MGTSRDAGRDPPVGPLREAGGGSALLFAACAMEE
jgi:hypothetical protein